MRRGFEGAARAFRTVKCLALHVAGAPLCGAFLRDLSVTSTKLSLCVCVSARDGEPPRSPMAKPSICVVSRVAGLREAFSSRGLCGPTIKWIAEPTAHEARAPLASCEVLVGEPAECAPLLDRCPNLQWLQSTFAGCNQLLAQPRRDFTATRLAGCFGPDMAEYTLLHILARERRYEFQRDLQRKKQWLGARSETGASQGGGAYRRMSSLTLGVLGLGDIGSCIAASAAHGLHMQVVGWRRDGSARPSDAASGVHKVYGGREQLPAFLGAVDYLVAVLPSTPQTRGLLDNEALAPCAARKPTMINVGRGDLLSEGAIVDALDRGWLEHYVGDVFDPEPLSTASPLWHHPHVTVTPHNSAVTQPSDVAEAFADNLGRYEAGGAAGLKHVFDWEAGY